MYDDDIKRARQKRQAEYLAGRYCASLALRALGSAFSTVATTRHRAPVWPSGIIGSITHTSDKAYAAVGYCKDFNYVGIDYEEIIQTKTALNIRAVIINEMENHVLNDSGFDFEIGLTLIFSAKESLFKALYPYVGEYFDFSAAQMIQLSKLEASFTLRLCESLSDDLVIGRCFTGWFEVGLTNILTVIAGADHI